MKLILNIWSAKMAVSYGLTEESLAIRSTQDNVIKPAYHSGLHIKMVIMAWTFMYALKTTFTHLFIW